MRFAYALLSLWALSLSLVFAVSDLSLGSSPAFAGFGVLMWILVSALVARRYGFDRIALFLEAVSFMPLVGAVTVATTFSLASISGPMRDAELIGFDAAIGFHWLQLFDLYQRTPGMMTVFQSAYSSFIAQVWLVPILLLILKKRDRLPVLFTAWSIASLLTAIIFPFAPADGPYLHYGITKEEVPELRRVWQWQFGPLINGIRSGEITEFSNAIMGIVSLPSFHTSGAIMFAWALYDRKILGPILILLNLGMIFSTLVNGAHYLADIIGGVVVAMVALAVATKRTTTGHRERSASRSIRSQRSTVTGSPS
ncbi:phosphatase PAP2 family protein [Sphingomonas lutea]|uniref:Phosphatase PAP2 family protein n=1 Tax=Sphingomonas lutea TaxID=1045317 RepID=A0A7G9SJ98_9SPHN|nr:phosphatase PAP2 family protein [Sphingomonas lutea]QNN67923.1 phosphatase PAP2 family protein [Sphingomonas lutea]